MCSRARSPAGTVSRRSWRKPSTNSPRPSSSKLLAVLIRMKPSGRRPAEQVDLVQQRRVLDDQRVGLDDRFAHADLAIVDAAEGDHRRADALGAEAREGLRVAALVERGDRQHLRRGDDTLAAAAVDAYLKHASQSTPPDGGPPPQSP